MSINLEKLAQMAKPQNEDKKSALRARRDDRGLRHSQDIALLLHYHLRMLGMTQAELAERMGVSAVYVNRVMKGTENLTLDTIGKLETALDVTLMAIPRP